jgi:hypothetical protein
MRGKTVSMERLDRVMNPGAERSCTAKASA